MATSDPRKQILDISYTGTGVIHRELKFGTVVEEIYTSLVHIFAKLFHELDLQSVSLQPNTFHFQSLKFEILLEILLILEQSIEYG